MIFSILTMTCFVAFAATDNYQRLPLKESDKPAIPPMADRYPIALDVYNYPSAGQTVPATGEALNFGLVTVIVDGVNLNNTLTEWDDVNRPRPALLRVPYTCVDPNSNQCNQAAAQAGYIDKTFVEMTGIFEAMGFDMVYQHKINNVEVRKITATRDKLKVEAWVGSRIAFLYMYDKLVKVVELEYAPFVTMEGRTMILLSFVADTLAARIDWENATKTATVTTRTNYFYDYPDHNIYTSDSFDYNAAPRYPAPNLAAVLDYFKSNPETYDIPFENHDTAGFGMFPQTGHYGDEKAHIRSEEVYGPFVLSGRRQTDSMMKSLYLTLPENIRRDYAFILPDRIAQNPEAYINYISSKQKAVVIGSFGGVGQATSYNDPKYDRVEIRHNRELFKLRATLSLLDALNVPAETVLYAMGDTTTTFGNTVRDDLEAELLSIMGDFNITPPTPALAWGADDMIAIAFARLLPQMKVYIEISNPSARHHFDGLRKSDEILREKLPTMGLVEVSDPAQADLELYVFTREPGIEQAMDAANQYACADSASCNGIKQFRFFYREPNDLDTYRSNGTPKSTCEKLPGIGPLSPGQWQAFAPYLSDSCNLSDGTPSNKTWPRIDPTKVLNAQRAFDQAFANKIANLSETRRKKTIIADARIPNGSWDNIAVPKNHTDYLVYSGWGTFANNLGMATAIGKVLKHARYNVTHTFDIEMTIERMYLEAVAHDVFANGYYHGQKLQKDSFAYKLAKLGITFNHHSGYNSLAETSQVFGQLTPHVSAAMLDHFSGSGLFQSGTQPFKFTAQFWRTYESEVHLWGDRWNNALFTPGVYRMIDNNNGNWYLNPVFRQTSYPNTEITYVDLEYLENEF
jgi:hypothetical protein